MTGNRCHRKIIFYVEHFLLKQSLRIIKIEASASMFLAKWGSCCMFRTPGSKSKKETKPPLSVKVCKAFVCSLRKRKRKERNHSHCKPIVFGCFKLVFILALKLGSSMFWRSFISGWLCASVWSRNQVDFCGRKPNWKFSPPRHFNWLTKTWCFSIGSNRQTDFSIITGYFGFKLRRFYFK